MKTIKKHKVTHDWKNLKRIDETTETYEDERKPFQWFEWLKLAFQAVGIWFSAINFFYRRH